jgi:hypothetical protein
LSLKKTYDYVQYTRILTDDELLELGQARYALVGFSETSSTIRYIFMREEYKATI